MTTKTQSPALDGSRVKALFKTVGERASDARDKAAVGRTRLADFTRDNVEALKESASIAGSGAKALGEEVVANVKREFAAVADGPKNLAGVKSYLEAARDDTKAFGQHLGEVAGEVVEPLKSRVTAITAKPKAATAKLAKPVVKAVKSKAEDVADRVERLVD